MFEIYFFVFGENIANTLGRKLQFQNFHLHFGFGENSKFLVLLWRLWRL